MLDHSDRAENTVDDELRAGVERVLLAVIDVTEVRADAKVKDDALRQNLVLLQEVRHRVANSLQIIASVLLQNAKKTQSEETRGHLKDAHHRVMSIAALERQLAASGERSVELKTYFANLCDSIAASMIADSEQIALAVTGTGGVVDDRVSVSLGLIVTELVINALKHALINTGIFVSQKSHVTPTRLANCRPSDDRIRGKRDKQHLHVLLSGIP